MKFKSKDVEFSTKINLGVARRLKEAGVIDLLDSESYPELSETLSSPIKALDLLWEIVKEQAEAIPMTKIEFEDNLELGEGLKALMAGVDFFIQELGPGSSTRWSGFQKHSQSVMKHQTEALEALMTDPAVKGMIEEIKDNAISEMMRGIKSTNSPES